MGWSRNAWVLVVALSTLSCLDLSTSSDAPLSRRFVVKGTVATGAHVRTPLAGAYVGLMEPQGPNGGAWIRLIFNDASGIPNEAVTSADGGYTFAIDMSVFDHPHTYPLYLAASDGAQTLTMLSEIPADLAKDGAAFTLDINPATTVAGQMICPGGVSPPPANTWCYSDPAAPSVDNAALIDILERALRGPEQSLETGTPPAWGNFASGFLNDPATFTEIKTNLTGQGITLGSATPQSIAATVAKAKLPLVSRTVSSSSSSSGSSGSSGGGSCRLVWDCGASTQCASVYGAKTGSAAEPDASTCQAVCKSQGACTCQGC